MTRLSKALYNQDINKVIRLLDAKANPNVAYTSTCPLTKKPWAKDVQCGCLAIIFVLTTGYGTNSRSYLPNLDHAKYPECRDFHLPNGQMLTFLMQRAYLSNSCFEDFEGMQWGTSKYERFDPLKDWQMMDLLLYYGTKLDYRIKHPRNVNSFPTYPRRLEPSRAWPKYDAPCTLLEYSNQFQLPFLLAKWSPLPKVCDDIQMLIRDYIDLEPYGRWYSLKRGHVQIDPCSKCSKPSIGVSNCKHLPVCYTHKRSAYFSYMCDCKCADCNSVDGQGQKGCHDCLEKQFIVQNYVSSRVED